MRAAVFVSLEHNLFTIAGLLVLSATVASAQSAAAAARQEVSTEANAVMALERQVELAYLHADHAFLRSTLREDFVFSHGTGLVAGKAETLANFAKPDNFLSRTLSSVKVELHGNVALTSGRIEVRSTKGTEYTICYLRLYERRDGSPWQLVSHRTFRQRSGYSETCSPN